MLSIDWSLCHNFVRWELLQISFLDSSTYIIRRGIYFSRIFDFDYISKTGNLRKFIWLHSNRSGISRRNTTFTIR